MMPNHQWQQKGVSTAQLNGWAVAVAKRIEERDDQSFARRGTLGLLGKSAAITSASLLPACHQLDFVSMVRKVLAWYTQQKNRQLVSLII